MVTADPARALYRKLGFQPYGLEPRALKVGDQVFDQELLVLRLDGTEPAEGDAMMARRRPCPLAMKFAILDGSGRAVRLAHHHSHR